MAAKSTLRSIGQVLSGLKGDFPDISISKIRFLESEGLLAPQRAPSGYRRYSENDVQRLRYILTAQRDQYLPLRVIRDQLARLDTGDPGPASGPAGVAPAGSSSISPSGSLVNTSTGPAAAAPTASGQPAEQPAPTRPGPAPVTGKDEAGASTPGSAASSTAPGGPSRATPTAAPTAPSTAASIPPGMGAPNRAARRPPVRLSRAELLRVSGLSEAALNELELIQVVQPRRGSHYYGREALAVAVAAKRLAVYGIDSRHLRAFKMAADREIGLVEQAIAPHVRRSRNGAEVTAEVTQLIVSVHAALVRIGMDR